MTTDLKDAVEEKYQAEVKQADIDHHTHRWGNDRPHHLEFTSSGCEASPS